jgi:lipoprotein
MRDQKNDHILYTVSISASLLSACYLAKNISNKTAITNKPENTALTNKPENTPLPHVEKIIYIEKEEYNKSSDNILKELGNVALLFSIVLLFLLLLYLALYFSKK